jgi:hypothetical protein
MSDSRKYYTYAFLREDGTPYYIGKGNGRRAYRTSSKSVPIPEKSRILILKRNLDKEEAYRHERYMIFIFGREDLGEGILLNRADGARAPQRMLNAGNHLYWETITEEERIEHGRRVSEAYSDTHRETTRNMNLNTPREEYVRRAQKAVETKKDHTPERREEINEKMRETRENWDEEYREEVLRKIGDASSKANKGRKTYVNEKGEIRMLFKDPGEGWQRGRTWSS